MDLELVGQAILSLPKIAYYKLRYVKLVQFSWVQAFGPRFSLHVKNRGYLHIGKELVTRENVTLRVDGGTLHIGNKCFFNAGCSLTALSKITIGDGCQIAQNVVIVDHDHDYKKGWGAYTSAPVCIGKNVWIGANCVILKGSQIGAGAVIAAGSIVRGEVPANTVFYQVRESKLKKVSHD